MGAIRFRWRPATDAGSVAAYRRLARRALPGMVWAYVEGGAEDHVTLRANRITFERWRLRQRVLTGHHPTSLQRTIAGIPLRLPVLLAPTGLTGLVHHAGELAAARAAEAAGTRAVLSTAASYTPEEIAHGTADDHLFQLYPWRGHDAGGRNLTDVLIDRARNAGFAALVVTVDTPTYGNREVEHRWGMGLPPTLTPGRVLDVAWHPRWWIPLLRERRVGVRILDDEPGLAAAVRSADDYRSLLRPDLRLDDLERVRARWEGPLFVKGVLDPDDAARVVDLGADGVIVSNHGGRQLDGAPSTLAVLPEIARRIGGGAQVLLDGGIRRGTDIVKALCLGADAVLIGRPFLYGLAAGGQDGVQEVIEILHDELLRALTLMGVAEVDQLDSSWLLPA